MLIFLPIVFCIVCFVLCWRNKSRIIPLYLLGGFGLFTYEFLWATDSLPGLTVSTVYAALRLSNDDLLYGYSLLVSSVAATCLLAFLWVRSLSRKPPAGKPQQVDYAILSEVVSWVGLAGLCYLRVNGASSLLDDWGRNWTAVPFAGVASYLSNGLCLSSVFWVMFERRWPSAPRYMAPLLIGCLLQLTSGTAGYAIAQTFTVGMGYILRDELPNKRFLVRSMFIVMVCLTLLGVYRYARGLGAMRAGVSTDFDTLKVGNSFTEIWAFSTIANDTRREVNTLKGGATYLPVVASLIPSFVGRSWKESSIFDQRTEIIIGREYMGVDVLIPATVYGEGMVNFGLMGLLIPIFLQSVMLAVCEYRRSAGVWSRVLVMFCTTSTFTGLRDGYVTIVGNVITMSAIIGVSYLGMRALGRLPRTLYPFAAVGMLAMFIIIVGLYLQRIR